MSEISQGDAIEARERALVSAPELSWALREVSRLSGQLDVALARRLHLRLLDNMALEHVMTAENPIGPAELSARLGISSGSGTELVDRLERAGHLTRQRDSHDRRRVALHVSASAVGSIIEELTPLFAMLDALEQDFTPDEKDVIVRYLRAAAARMREFIQESPATPPTPPEQ